MRSGEKEDVIEEEDISIKRVVLSRTHLIGKNLVSSRGEKNKNKRKKLLEETGLFAFLYRAFSSKRRGENQILCFVPI